jgi:hypothetical protein
LCASDRALRTANEPGFSDPGPLSGRVQIETAFRGRRSFQMIADETLDTAVAVSFLPSDLPVAGSPVCH